MVKTLNFIEFKGIADELLSSWDSLKKEIKLGGKSMYSLISLKKEIEKQGQTIAESIIAIGEQYGGAYNDQGRFIIPEENIEKVNSAIAELGQNEVEFQYNPVILSGEDNLPAELMDLLFDFIEFKE